MALGFLWSCQSEDVVANSPAPKTEIKKHFELDGIPCDADDYYEFSKSQYYQNNKLLIDTLQIKKLLSNARLLQIDGTRKDICVTDQEVNMLNQKLKIPTSTSAKTDALDGDNYLQYFYEIARYDKTRPTVYCEFMYFSIVGPHTHSSALLNAESYQFSYCTRTGLSGSPTYVKDYNTAIMTGGSNFRDLYQLLSNCENTNAWLPESKLEHFDVNYTINVVNHTRFTRSVEIVADNGTVIRFTILPKGKRSLSGSHSYAGVRTTNGINNFIVKWVRSNKV